MRTAFEAYICFFIVFICAVMCTVFLAITVVEHNVPLFTIPMFVTITPIVAMYVGSIYLLWIAREYSHLDKRYKGEWSRD